MREKAFAYAAKGKAIFPIHSVVDGKCTCSKPECLHAGKHPRTRNGLKDATTDHEQIKKWWNMWPDANIGMLTGQGTLVVDIDLPDGIESLAKLEEQYGSLPPTLEVKTGSGGRHLFFSTDAEMRNTTQKLGKKIDSRCDGGYVILPPSLHESGNRYEWANKEPIAKAPDWLIEKLTRPSEREHTPTTTPGKYGQKALAAELAELTGTGEGSRNHRLNQAAYSLGQLVAGGELDHGQVEAALSSAAASIGLSTQETQQTIKSGLEAGMREPRTAPAPEQGPLQDHDGGQPEPTEAVKEKWPAPLAPEAMPGLIKTFIDTATENSEADPAAILATLLVRFSISCGNAAFFHVGDNKHYARLNAAIVGETAIGRKGTSAGPVNSVFELIQDACRTSPGPLSTGEGITYAVRDEVQEWKIDNKTKSGEMVVTDPGIEDKRLAVIEEEFASALQATKRDGNTLSAIVRTLFDSGNCEPLTKSNRIKCTGAHVGIVAHITLFELQKLLSANERLNGFGNRFLWICSKRPKLVAFPEPMPEQFKKDMAAHIERAISHAREGGEYTLSGKAKELWGDLYPDLAEGRQGIAGAMIGRAAPYVLRLAFTYCLFRSGAEIDVVDLEAALAFWRYADQSAGFIFGGTVAPDRDKQKILMCIGNAQKSKTEIRIEAFSNHITAEKLGKLLANLEDNQVISSEMVQSSGPPTTFYRKNQNFSGVLSALSVLTPADCTETKLKKHKTHKTHVESEKIDDSVFAGVVNGN